MTDEPYIARALSEEDRIGARLLLDNLAEPWGVFRDGELWAVAFVHQEDFAPLIAAAANLSHSLNEHQKREAETDRTRRSGRWE